MIGLWDKLRARAWQLATAGMGAVAIALATLWLVAATGERHQRKLADNRAEALAAERVARAVEQASIRSLQSSLAIKNAESAERAAAYEASRRQAAADGAAADARWKATADQVERLRAIAARPAASGCEAPAELLAALEGL